jgi:nonribosomal peptide synthetase protein VioO
VDEFVRTALAHSFRTAIRDEDGREVSYAELHQRVLATAERLGAGPGVVAVSLPRSAEAVVAMLAVWAAGGTYCPVDPCFPPERQRALTAAAGATLLLDGEGISAVATGAVSPTAWLHEEPAYVLFTSGSTGQPKPVMTSRRAIATVTASLRSLFELDADDRVLQFASLNWDTCFEEILPTLSSGARLVIDQATQTGSVPALLRLVEAEQVTVVDLPTAYWHVLVAHLALEGGRLPGCLRLVVIGGEPVSPVRLGQWHALGTADIRLVNTYGCTETTLITHAAELVAPMATVPIGRPLPHVVEQVAEDGELLIAGPAVALGYRAMAEETERRFRVEDHGDGPRRWFHTRDRVSRTVDGQLEHRGRLDGELKVRGIRVDPGEVEVEIGRHAGVLAVAVAGSSVADHVSLVAYVVPAAGADAHLLPGQLLADLRSRVPAHLVPSRVVVVPELVHTDSGKVDRAASHARHGSAGVERADTMSAEAVALLFARILEVERVGPDADFFDEGGDSLLATRVLSAVFKQSGVELTFDDFAGASSPASLAKLIGDV